MTRLTRLTPQQVFMLCAAATLIAAAVIALRIDPAGEDQLKIFGSFWVSGWAASTGLDPYAMHPLVWITDLGVAERNMNPPTLLPLFQLFALFDAAAGARAWTVLTALLFVGTTGLALADRRFACDRHQIAWIFLAPPLASTLALGQIYVLLFALGAGGWLLLKHNRGVAAGLLIGLLVAIKPNFAVWPALLLLAGHWRPAVSAALVAASLGALSVGLYGLEVYRQWFAAVAADQHIFFATEVSVGGYLTRIGLPGLAVPAAAALVLGVAAWVWRRRFGALDTSRLALVVSILASPLAWLDYALVLVPALIERPWNRTLKTAAVLLVLPPIIPTLSMYGPDWTLALGGAVYFGGLCLVLAAFVGQLRAVGQGKPAFAAWRRASAIIDPARPGPA